MPNLVVGTFLYATLVPISSTVAISFARRKGQMVARIQLAIALLGILLFTAFLANVLAQAYIFLRFFTLRSTSFSQRAETINALIVKCNVVDQWLTLIPPVVNDAFIIWRAWVVFEKRRWALYLSIVLNTLTLGKQTTLPSLEYANSTPAPSQFSPLLRSPFPPIQGDYFWKS
ncbi:hypothetical protein H0H93_007436 [Arthromyces matolae]|nr:hypothetical protein H0H93_007436 [Arthromyces matolae]